MSTVHSHTAGEGSGGTSGAHTFFCGTWYSLLWVTSPAKKDLSVLTPIT